MNQGQIKISGQIEKGSNAKGYLKCLEIGLEHISEIAAYTPTKKIEEIYGNVNPEEREITLKISHNWIGYLVTDFGTPSGKEMLYPLRTKGYIQETKSPKNISEVKPKKLEELISRIGNIKIGKDLIE